MSWWKRKKCGTCKKVLKKKMTTHELRLQTADGMLEIEICDDCARFFDKSAEVLNATRRKKPSYPGAYGEVHSDDDT